MAAFCKKCLRPLQLHKILWHADGSRELVDGAVRVLTQQIVRKKKLDGERVRLTFEAAVRVECLCVHENRV